MVTDQFNCLFGLVMVDDVHRILDTEGHFKDLLDTNQRTELVIEQKSNGRYKRKGLTKSDFSDSKSSYRTFFPKKTNKKGFQGRSV